MRPEDKQLLLADLSARLPYETKVYWANCNYGDKIKNVVSIDIFGMVNDEFSVEECKPYLRPMSSMTEEEEQHVEKYFTYTGYNDWDYVGWLLKHHFDFRGLIDKGLALSTETFNPYIED